MSKRKYSSSFMHGASKLDISLDISQIGKKQPLLNLNSCAEINQLFQLELIRDKYQKQYNVFHRAQHKRSKSQIDKINRVLQDAHDLNDILDGTNIQKVKENINKQKRQDNFDFARISEQDCNEQIKMISGTDSDKCRHRLTRNRKRIC